VQCIFCHCYCVDLYLGLICDVNKTNELMCVSPKYSMKFYNHISVSQLGYRHLSPVTPHASTLGETASASQVLPKESVVKVLLVHC
jgi:hypothetical protein